MRGLVCWELPGVGSNWIAYVREEDGIVAWRYVLAKGWLIVVIPYHPGYVVLAISKWTPNIYHDVWIYTSLSRAHLALSLWNVFNEQEPWGWYRHPSTGRRREYNDDTGVVEKEWFQP